MKNFWTLLIFTLFFSCSKDEEVRIFNGSRLLSIEYFRANQSWLEEFSYDTLNTLRNIENSYQPGYRYAFEYENNKVVDIRRIQTLTNIEKGRDSITYNHLGNIERIYFYRTNTMAESKLSSIDEFQYAINGRLVSKLTHNMRNNGETTYMMKYFWDADNIIHVEDYGETGKLEYEYFYTYDDKFNYQKGYPLSLYDPVSWGKHNIISTDFRDHVGNLDLVCWPCERSYKYNDEGFPIEIQFNYDRKLILEYAQ